MTASRTYITTTIPYVNARPHLGFALELVQADVLARRARQRGEDVRALTGTDDNSLKNVLAARAEGVPVRELVDRNAAAFEALREPLDLSFDDFIRTSSDPRHRSGVERLWELCDARGDLYRKHYSGLYCVGCEQFYAPEDLVDGRCPEHGTEPQLVSEENWFFRLSRYADQLRELIGSGRLRIEPASRRNEILSLIDSGLHDFSVSRSHSRAHGWGIPVPGDPSQVVYVWWDALGNYVTSLGFGTDHPDYATWWGGSERRIHLVGKGVIRFHAVYWPAMLLSAGLPLPTEILVHDYLTIDGRKISKSSGATADPARLVAQAGTDAVRWWLLREVPRVGDADFTLERLVERANAELAGGLGNLVHRTITMIHKYRGGAVPTASGGGEALKSAYEEASAAIDEALDDFDFRRATSAVWRIVDEANRAIDGTRPWELARAERDGDLLATERLDAALAALHAACVTLAASLTPFLPSAAELIAAQCTPVDGVLPQSAALFPRIEV
ncbi:methionine--tRNA ligase [Actinospica sp.]|jgi:methionyl-tRNA synthetase|uniref:methionine--tRNA ligase n=1 Tax=Actinospica sp. TaxID=1872142 RepID=UPI002B5C8565|nr:methionine--tRNA ligase [Actinospica sp.]HWG27987.1 methionine--tRNA ligase [Actinospica sp.]